MATVYACRGRAADPDPHVAHAIAGRRAASTRIVQAGDLRELARGRRQPRDAVVQRLEQDTSRDGDLADDVAERMDLDHRAA